MSGGAIAGDRADGAPDGRDASSLKADGRDGGDRCLNCGTVLSGPYCAACGQSAHIHRSVAGIWHDLLHGVLHVEGKLRNTLPLLAFNPGKLTRRYIAGERVRFVTPIALFLFSIFSMFATFSILGISPPAEIDGVDQVRVSAQKTGEEVRAQRSDLVKRRDALRAGDPQRAKLDAQIVENETELAQIDKLTDLVDTPAQESETHTGWARIDHGIEKWNKNPGLMLYKLQSTGYKFSWLLIPISLPFMWSLFFWRREFRMYDHAVFVTYSIAFMSLLFIVLAISGAIGIGPWPIALAGTLIPLWHIHRQLRQAYRLHWLGALWREAVLLFFMLIVNVIFLLVLIALGLVG